MLLEMLGIDYVTKAFHNTKILLILSFLVAPLHIKIGNWSDILTHNIPDFRYIVSSCC